MTEALTYAYVGELTKSRDDKGVLHIKGIATDDSLDLDGQRCDPEWLKGAMSDWFKVGNIREMHQMSAIGKAHSMTQKGTGFEIEAAIIDPLAAEKFETGVYSYLSIGIKGARIDRSEKALETTSDGWIRGGKIVEISGCDVGSNQNAKAAPCELVKTVGGVTEKTDALGEIDETSTAVNESTADPAIPAVVDTPVESAVVEPADEVKSPLSDISKSFAELTKAATHDPAELNALRSSFVALIKAELDELDAGEDDEISDIYQLLSSLSTFLSWWDDEADEGETDEPFNESGDDTMAYVGLGVSADLIKSATADDATPEVKDELRTELRKALGLGEIATKADTEALQEVIKGLEATLEDVRKMAAPSNLSIKATLDLQGKAAQADELDIKAARFAQTAYEQTDQKTAQQYIDAAAALRAQAAGLRS